MAISVAPLTTAVLNAVPAHETGTASAINNADASLASLLAVAIFGMLALGFYNRALDHHVENTALPAETRQAVEAARGKFIVPRATAPNTGAAQLSAQAIIKTSLGESIQKIMMLAALLALGAAASGAMVPRSVRPQTR